MADARGTRFGLAVRALSTAIALIVLSSSLAAASDRDGDGLRDAFETRWGVTDPDRRDSDGDGVIDSAEDSDGDRLGNLGEQRFKTDPGTRDSDGDGKNDGAEDRNRNGINNAAEQDRRPLPSGLRPSLFKASRDFASARNDCIALFRVSRLVRCSFGDLDSDTTVALMGDSHALMWTPAFRRAASQEGWKLVTLLKGACSAHTVVNIGQWKIDRGRSCNKWRYNALAWLRQHPPDLLVITSSDGYRIVDNKGGTVPNWQRPNRWRKGLAKTLAALPPATAVAVLGDTPGNRENPVSCLKRHRTNISACSTRRASPGARKLEQAERRAAAAAGADFTTLYYKVCTYDPCPLVQGNTMMWRDRGHITATFAKRLTPSVRDLIRKVLP